MILNFLQTRDPPILPALHQISHQAYIASDGSESGFSDNLDEVRDFGKANTETTAQLLFHFFRRYGHEVEYEKDVISVRHGKLLSRGEKGWDHAKEAQWRLCVEEPFNTTRNLGNTADPTAFRGIHLEIRQAFNYLADGAQLGKCCEQFEFPPEEKNIFKKPTPTHKPAVLTAPPNTRGGRGVSATIRAPNSRNSPNFRSPQGNRRSSSGASFANYRPPFGYSPPVNYPGLETPEQLQQQYMFNANRLMALKAQLDASQQAHYYAQAHAEAHAQARLGLVPATAPPHRPHFITGPTATQVLDDGRIHPAHYAAYGYPQRSPYDMSQPMSLSTSQEGSRTHPASPSMASAVPALRRSSQRSMGPSGVQSSSVRSQSQPARAIPGHMLVAPGAYPPPPMPAYDPNTYNTAAQPNGADLGAMVSDLPLRTGRTMSVIDPAPGSGPSREYVGYYLDETPQVQQQPPTNRLRESFQLPPIPSYGEMKRQRAGHDLMQVPVSIQTRRASRSPSPLGHMRSYSTASGLRSAPLPSMQLAQTPRQRIESTQASYEAGPLVVNGSYSSSAPTWDSQSTADDTQTDITDLTNESFASTMTAPPHVQSAYDVFGIQPLETAPEASSSVSDPLVATATRVNGALQEAQQSKPKPNGVVVVSSQPRQPTESFPPLPHSSSPEVPLPPERRGSSTSPPAATPGSAKSPWHNSTSSRSPVPPLDLSKVSSSEVAKAPLASVAPVLSPVMETRTPSPTASRSGRNTATPKAVKANGSIVIANGTYADVGRIESAKEIVTNTSNGPLASRTNRNSVPALKQDAAAEKPTASASQPPAPQPTAGQQQQQQQQQQQPGQWQTTGTKKKKRVRAKSNAQKGGPVPGEGEVMPANEAERKGG
ncbi:MAG: hypothetical protein INR71_01055 [Terriglobus roseus]|nr:hypothetical protein [Terriglobus roseus]